MTRENKIKEICKHNEDFVFVEEFRTDDQVNEIYEALKYPQRRKDGQRFSDMQGAKLLISNAPDSAKKEISDFFIKSQEFLNVGWWKSALRELHSTTPNAYVSQSLLTNAKTYIANYINNSY